MGLFDKGYMQVIQRDDNVLHLKRTPTWKSVVLFIGLWAITHFVSIQAQYQYLGFLCYVLVVSELSELIGATVISVKPTMFGEAHQVVLIYLTGLTLSVTGSAIYGNKKYHQEILDEIKDFMGFKLTEEQKSTQQKLKQDKKNE